MEAKKIAKLGPKIYYASDLTEKTLIKLRLSLKAHYGVCLVSPGCSGKSTLI